MEIRPLCVDTPVKKDRSVNDKLAKGRLTSSWKAVAHRLALGFTLLTSGCLPGNKTGQIEPDTRPTSGETSEAAAKSTSPKSDPPPFIDMDETVILTSREQARHDRINTKLLQAAQKDYLKLAGLSSAEGYSQQLAAMQENLNARLQGDASVHNRVVVLDPEKFEIGIALGLSDAATVSKMLREQHLDPDEAMKKTVASKIGLMSDDRYAGAAITQDPTALTNLTLMEAAACVIVPSSEHALVVDIKGLSPQEQVNYANKHEGWHCLDSKYTLRGIDPKELAKQTKGPLSANVDNKTMLAVFANQYNKEALADLGAIGDMIRQEGYGLDLADKISDWRKRHPNEVDHLSSPVIEGFKARVAEMGIESFRKLDDEQAKALYFEVTDKFGMTARSIEFNLRLEKMNVAGRIAFVDANDGDPEMAKAVDFMGYYFHKPVERAGPLTEDEKRLAGELRQWNAGLALEDKAFATAGKITPATLVQAYGALQDSLHAERFADPGNPLLAAKMTKLEQTFLNHVQSVDYVIANQKRGVDITQAEHALLSPKMAKKGGGGHERTR